MKKTRSLKEGLEFKDMEGLVKPTVYIDEFQSKVGNDDEYIVLSFCTKGEQVADDLVHWFETGYQFVIDADKSEGEIEPNRYLVFVEIERRTRFIEQLRELLEDLDTLTDFVLEDWVITTGNKSMHFDPETLAELVPLSPQSYREMHDIDINEMRTIAGLPVKEIYNATDDEINAFRTIAGLPVKK